MYQPSDDTFLLAECIKQYSGQWALEIGVGSGLLLPLLEDNFQNVVGSDISLQAIEYCKRRNTGGAMLVCCDAASALRGMFDLIVSNPPYLPDDNRVKDLTVHGGPTGIETTIHFICSAIPVLAQEGKIVVVVSSLANSLKLDKMLLDADIKIHKRVIKEKKLFYETLSVVEISREMIE
jgi:release factor glutamine methyltransferase